MSAIEYFYAAHSAYAYIGSARFMAIAAAAGRRIDHRPVDLDRVLLGAGSTPFKDRPLAVKEYFFNREMERWMEYRGVRSLGGRPAWHHHSPDLANRVLIAALHAGHVVDDLAHRMLEAHWADDADLADETTLVRIANASGLDGEALLAASDAAAVRDAYDANTREAIDRGVLGSPTYFVDGDMFYGQDRLELVERALQRPFARTWAPRTA